MKDYMVTHTFKSEEIRQQYFAMSEEMDENTVRSQMKNENASFQINWNAGEDNMVMYCWWKANSPEAIIETLGEMGEMFHNDIKEMPNIIDISDSTFSYHSAAFQHNPRRSRYFLFFRSWQSL